MNTYTNFFALLMLLAVSSQAEIAVGDTFIISAGYSNFIGMSGGTTEAVEVLDSIKRKGDTTFYHFSVISTKTDGVFEMGGTMVPLITNGKTQLAILSSKPTSIQSHSPRFNGLDWILSEKSSILFYESIYPIAPLSPIPIDHSSQSYSENDYYVVRHTDRSGIKWTKDEVEDRWFQGNSILFESAQDSIGTIQRDSLPMPACGTAPTWIPTNAGNSGENPLRFYRFGTSSQSAPLSGAQMAMGEGCYSTQLTYYKPVKPSHVEKPFIKDHTILTNNEKAKIYYSLDGKRINLKNKRTSGIFITINECFSLHKRAIFKE